MTAPLLQLRDVSLRIGETDILDDIHLDVAEGELVALLGPSGAGKSSIFKLITGALEPDRGEILFKGQSIDRRGQFAFMPQRDALMPWRRIIDNVALGLEVRGLSRRQARARVAPDFARFGLAGFEDHYPDQLSGGMRQRAALLRTVAQHRPMLLLDEPFGALDALTRTETQRWLEGRWQANRWTTLLITHDVREAVYLADRVYVLSRRPARVLREFRISLPRPRFGGSAEAHAIETEILNCILDPKGTVE